MAVHAHGLRCPRCSCRWAAPPVHQHSQPPLASHPPAALQVVNNSIAGEMYVLYQCGSTAPASSAPGVPADAKYFEIPLTSLSAPETVPYAFVVRRFRRRWHQIPHEPHFSCYCELVGGPHARMHVPHPGHLAPPAPIPALPCHHDDVPPRPPTPLTPQEYLGLADRVYDVSSYVVSPCGQKLLQCAGRTAPDPFSANFRWGWWVGWWLMVDGVSYCTYFLVYEA